MSTALKQMTVEEFFLWAEGKEGRWELHDGVPVMMSPERSGARSNQSARLPAHSTDALRRGRSAVRGDRRWHGRSGSTRGATYEPDASVVCGPRRSDETIVVTDPVIVVEVLSPSTAAIDHGRKLSGYFSLPSVQHYLILDPERRVAIHHKRGAGDAIETRVLTDGVARLDPPGFEVAVEALFPPA